MTKVKNFHKKAHHKSEDDGHPAAKDIIGRTEESVWKFMSERFPNLVIEVYNVLKEPLSKSDSPLKSYYTEEYAVN